jgi:asparagine synthase (glutamine-hydrolysing)
MFEQGDDADPEEAAARLREVLGRAVRERLAVRGTTTVWMSGGYDSPSVFALGRANRANGQEVVPVSMSYPLGDKGREDELIQKVADHFGAQVAWVRRQDVAGLPDPVEWAERRDEAVAHPYECWNRALVAGTRSVGARVALTGNGGDQFFGVSGIFLGDLVRTMRLPSLYRELRALGLRLRGLRELFHWAVKPNLPQPMLRFAAWIRGGRRLGMHLQRQVPSWLVANRAFLRALYDRQWQFRQRRPGESLASAEASWYLHTKHGQRIISIVGGLALADGVEVRSPMYDQRVLNLIARRPREDRYSNAENKRLLRRSLRGLLPPEHLAPRRNRTGLPGGYLAEALPKVLPAWLGRLGSLWLADMGLVNPKELQQSLDQYLRNPVWESQIGVQVLQVVSVEYWIRRHRDRGVSQPQHVV